MKQITDAPVVPSHHAVVTPELEAVCLRALSKAADDRFASAREMRAALRAALARTTPAGALAAAIELTPRPQLKSPDTLEVMKGAGSGAPARRRRAAITIAGLVVVGLVAGAFAARSMFGIAPPHEASPATAVAAPRPAPPAPVPAAAPAPAGAAPIVPPPAPEPGGPAVALAKPAGSGRPERTRRTRDRLVRASNDEASPTPETVALVAPPAPAVAAPPAPPPPAPRAPTAARAAPAPSAAVRPTAAAVAPTPPPPPPARIDVEHATVSISAVTTTSAIPGSNVRAAFSRAPLARCYRDALRAGAPTSGTAMLHLRIDATGYVTAAGLRGGGVTPALAGCIEKAATTIRIKDVDTGDATADVTLSFVATP